MVNAVVPAGVARQHTQTRINPDVHVDRVTEVLKVLLLLFGRVPTNVLSNRDFVIVKFAATHIVGEDETPRLVGGPLSQLLPYLTGRPQHGATEYAFCHLSRESVIKVFGDHVFVSTMLNAATEAVR